MLFSESALSSDEVLTGLILLRYNPASFQTTADGCAATAAATIIRSTISTDAGTCWPVSPKW